MDLRSLGTAYLGSSNLGSMNLDSARLLGGRQRDTGPDLASFEETLRNAAARNAPEENVRAAPAAQTSAHLLSRTTPVGVTIDRESELFQQCLELEIFLVKTLINSMRSTIQRSGLIEQSFAGEMYEDMLFDERARQLTENANFGLAELAYLELTGQRGRVVLR